MIINYNGSYQHSKTQGSRLKLILKIVRPVTEFYVRFIRAYRIKNYKPEKHQKKNYKQ